MRRAPPTQAWLDSKDSTATAAAAAAGRARVAPAVPHLLDLVATHKGNVADLVAQLRSLNKAVTRTMAQLREATGQAEARCVAIKQTVAIDPTLANDQDVRCRVLRAVKAELKRPGLQWCLLGACWHAQADPLLCTKSLRAWVAPTGRGVRCPSLMSVRRTWHALGASPRGACAEAAARP